MLLTNLKLKLAVRGDGAPLHFLFSTLSRYKLLWNVHGTANRQVLESGGSTYSSDVYSFGIVVWEVISRQLPWANKTRPRNILSAVLIGIRPSFQPDAPADIVAIAEACWGGEPEERTTFDAILAGMKANGWHE